MTSAGTYVRTGFVDGAAAARGIERLGDAGLPLTDELAAAADPDAALDGLLRLVDALDEQSQGAGREMLAEVADDEGTAMRLCSVLGASTALAPHLTRSSGASCPTPRGAAPARRRTPCARRC